MTAALEGVRRVVVTNEQLVTTRDFLRTMGERYLEGLVIWAGVVRGDLCEIHSVVVPRQSSIATPSGLLLSLDDTSLHDLNRHLYESGQRLIAQVHSHGEHAYHSETDNKHSIVTALGGWSIVVPHFASSDDLLCDCAVLRLSRDGWVELSDTEVYNLIEVI